MATNDNEKLTITLTGRPPVRITKDDWPIIASASDKAHDNEYEFQANRKAEWKLIVRQHADGRTIVYGIYTYSTSYRGSHSAELRGGELLAADTDIPAAIAQVASALEVRMPEGVRWGPGVFPRLAHECTADLPAVEI